MTSSIADDLIAEYQVMWTLGALERLATLGFLQATPYNISQKGIDIFVQLDEHRDKLFADDFQMKELLKVILKTENGIDDPELLENMFVLMKDYKNDRERIVKYALSQQFS